MDAENGDAAFLLRLLRIAAADDSLNPDDLEFAVITAGSAVTETPAQIPYYPGIPGSGKRRRPRTHVEYYPFEKGEIIVLPKEGYREPFGIGRSTAKWDVTEERFGHDWDAAVRRSAEVKAAPDRDGFR